MAAVGAKLAEVLAEVHARGVLHRDINASNVLIDDRGAVTLLDLGSAELCENFYDVPAGARRYLTPPEARVVIPHGGIGALAWSAPEVRAGSGWIDKSDVYSIGHLLFRLLTGKVPVTDGQRAGTVGARIACFVGGGLIITAIVGLFRDARGTRTMQPDLRSAMHAQVQASGPTEALTISFSQALPLTGLSRNTLYNLLKAGKVPGARKLGMTHSPPLLAFCGSLRPV